MDPDTQTFRLLDPDGQEIMNGPMSAIMERLPDTQARNSALEEAVHAAVEAVQAEERATEARACAAQIITDTVTRLTTRLDAYIAHQEEQQRRDAEEAERKEQEEIQSMLDQLPDPDAPERTTDQDPEGILPDPDDPTGTSIAGDDGDLTLKAPVDPEKYGPVEEDADPEVKAALSYGKVPLSYVKKHDSDPLPFDPDAPGASEVPPTGPEPGSIMDPPKPGIPQPVSISLNSEEEAQP
jgi:hypothetical protein